MNAQEHTRLLTVKEVAAVLGQHRITVYRAIERGEIPAVRLGAGKSAPIRVREETLEALLQPATERHP
jgi:excisionase family DNA binding protein